MHRICAILVVSLDLCAGIAAQQNEAPKPKVSSNRLTAEQIAIYRAVLFDYTRGADVALSLSNSTVPLDESAASFEKSCMPPAVREPPTIAVPIVHRLDHRVALSPKMLLVDRDRQQETVNANDPQKLMKRAIDDHESVSEKQVNDSVKQAFDTGLFTLSEILFDKQHRRAVVAYGFFCGMLCGHGSTLALKKIGGKWKVSKICSAWVS
jgi:hypothetical protein